jgi:hypothetical protein
MEWADIIWKLIIAVGPILVGVLVRIVQDFVLTRSEAQQETIRSWIQTWVKAAQMIEPDPAKRKAWVIGKVCAMFPRLPQEQVSALIEAILADLKLEYEAVDWSKLPPAA